MIHSDEKGNEKVFIGGPDIAIDKGQVSVWYHEPPSSASYFIFIISQDAEMTIRGVMDTDKPSNNYVNSAHYQVAGRLLIDSSMLYSGSIELEASGWVHLSKNVELKLFDSEQVKGSLFADQGSVTGETGSKINFEATNQYSRLNGKTPDKAIYHWRRGAWVK